MTIARYLQSIKFTSKNLINDLNWELQESFTAEDDYKRSVLAAMETVAQPTDKTAWNV